MQTESRVLTVLKHTPDLVASIIGECPQEILKRRPPSGRWSIYEHACHLSVVQPMFTERLELMLREPRARITPYTPSEEEAGGSLLEMDLDSTMEGFSAGRGALVERLEGIGSEEWHRQAEHPEYGRYSVFIMMRMVAMHDLFHGYRMNDLLLNRDWTDL